MSHLGTTVSALVDGQLHPADAERVLGHVASCSACAEEVAAAREARRAMLAAFDVPANPDLTRRLLTLGATSDDPGVTGRPVEPAHGARDRRGGPRTGPARDVRFDDSLPLPGSGSSRPRSEWPDALSGDLRRRRGARRWLVAASTGVGVVAAGLFVLGQQPEVAPSAHPAHALTILGRAAGASSGVGTADDPAVWSFDGALTDRTAPWDPAPNVGGVTPVAATAPSSGPPGGATSRGATGAARSTTLPYAVGAELEHRIDEATERVLGWLAREGWSAPARLPDGYRIAAVRLAPEGPGSVEMDLTGTRGLIVATLQHGRLDPDVVADAIPAQTDGGTLYVLSSAPWHAVWQAGGTVVSVVAQRPAEVLEELVVAFPLREYDAGPAAAINRGWHELAGAWGR